MYKQWSPKTLHRILKVQTMVSKNTTQNTKRLSYTNPLRIHIIQINQALHANL